jgi:peptidoglycan/LPS O-acetylase OafA/YrhL
MDVDEAVSKPVRLSSIHRPALDGTRGLAILLVLLAHTMQSLRYTRGDVTPLELAIGRFFMLGTSGVDLFFVLSGFLITGILLDTKEDANYFIRFYWRRVLRVFPLYYTALAVIGGGFGLAAFLLRHPAIKVSMNPLWYVFYLENFKWQAFDERVAPFWSLAIEEQFYLIWPLTVLRLGRKQLAGVCGTMVAIALLLRVIATAGGNYNQAYYDTPMRMDGLALGAFLAIAVRDPALGDRIRLLGRKVLMPATCFLIASIAIDWSGGPQVLGVPTIGRTCFAIVYGGIVLAAFDGAQQKILPRLLSLQFHKYTHVSNRLKYT